MSYWIIWKSNSLHAYPIIEVRDHVSISPRSLQLCITFTSVVIFYVGTTITSSFTLNLIFNLTLNLTFNFTLNLTLILIKVNQLLTTEVTYIHDIYYIILYMIWLTHAVFTVLCWLLNPDLYSFFSDPYLRILCDTSTNWKSHSLYLLQMFNSLLHTKALTKHNILQTGHSD